VVHEDDWGDRALAYPIERKTDAEYHLLQFHAGKSELLSELDRTLRITDGVLRYRIVKLRPGTPQAPDMRAGASAAAPPRHGESFQSPRPAEAPGELAASEPA
jgi:small subunit ribosomal protein S6